MVSGMPRRRLTPVKGDPSVNLLLARTFESCEHRRRRIDVAEANGAARQRLFL